METRTQADATIDAIIRLADRWNNTDLMETGDPEFHPWTVESEMTAIIREGRARLYAPEPIPHYGMSGINPARDQLDHIAGLLTKAASAWQPAAADAYMTLARCAAQDTYEGRSAGYGQ